MHGLVNRALQRFVCDTYGGDAWTNVADLAAVGVHSFEAMLSYDDAVTDAMLLASATVMGKPREALLEDLGLYLVAHPNCEVLRRLLRFGGDTFSEFLSSLDDLPERARLAVPDLNFPAIETVEMEICAYEILVWADYDGPGRVLAGVLQGMADDYGALATIEYQGQIAGGERLAVLVHDMAFAEGRKFDLAPAAEP